MAIERARVRGWMGRLSLLALSMALAGLGVTASAEAATPAVRPWLDTTLTPDQRASALVKAMTPAEKFRLIHSDYGATMVPGQTSPAGGKHNAAFIPALPRLGLPAIQETDAGLGVALQHAYGDGATNLPSGLSTASSFDPALARAGGAMIGNEAHNQGFNVMLAGGVNLMRDPRNGRNFEYAGEDPLLAGTLVGAFVSGIESAHVVSTVKHFALNDQETNRNAIDAQLDHTAARESDLLAFQIAIETGHPGSVMCSYNRVDAIYACENDWLLNQVLKRDWKYPGFVMSDWGAVHSTVAAAQAGLDQESAGNEPAFDKQEFFGKPLREAVAAGKLPQSRIDDMVHRIARSLFAAGVVQYPAKELPIDYSAHALVSQHAAEAGTVLLRNQDALLPLLPLSPQTASIAVIGSHADKGVVTGGGSSAVTPRGGSAVTGVVPTEWPGPRIYQPSAPLAAIGKRTGGKVSYASGDDIAAAVKLASQSTVAVVFVTQWTSESFDVPSMALPGNQDALVAAVAKANPHTIVVLENNGPVNMPWLDNVGAVMEAWYPGVNGGEAIARLLFGEVAPSGHLPLSWPRDESQLPRATIPGAGLAAIGLNPQGPPATSVDYNFEGADVGYRWFQKRGIKPLFPFGYGLTYTQFDYGKPTLAKLDGTVTMSFSIKNTGKREGVALPQMYVTAPGTDRIRRLAGWQRVMLKAGQTRQVTITASAIRLADFDEATHGWKRAPGDYRFELGESAANVVGAVTLPLAAADCNLTACKAMP